MTLLTCALIAGSFDPPTLGHLHLIKRASALFTPLHVGIPMESSRSRALFSPLERVELLSALCADQDHILVRSYSGLTVDFAKRIGAQVLVRGIRSLSDLDLERDLAAANQTLSGIETLLFSADPAFSHISGRLVREIGRSGHSLAAFVPEAIERAVVQRLTSASGDPSHKRLP